jgi:hypothetical protein
LLNIFQQVVTGTDAGKQAFLVPVGAAQAGNFHADLLDESELRRIFQNQFDAG